MMNNTSTKSKHPFGTTSKEKELPLKAYMIGIVKCVTYHKGILQTFVICYTFNYILSFRILECLPISP